MAISNSEHLARFLKSEGWFNQGQVKGEAFRPRKDRGALRTSVIRHNGTNPDEIKRSGNAWKEMPRRPTPVNFLGWADVMVGAVRTISTIPSLDVEEAGSKGNPHHANIVGWNLYEGQHMIQAEEVAQQSTLVLI